MKTMKTFFVTMFALVAIALGFATTASACDGGNQCQNAPTPGLTASGWGQTVGGYEASGGSWNNGSGPVVARGSMSESGGAFNGTFSFNGTTCNDAACANNAQAGGVGSAFQRSATFIETAGKTANTNASGGATAGGGSEAASQFGHNRFNFPIY